jgi:D-xylose transport system permease protein
MLGWSGTLLLVLGNIGTVYLRDKLILSLAGTFYPHIVGWILAVLLIKGILISGLIIAEVAVMNSNRGLPSAVVIFVGLGSVWSVLIGSIMIGPTSNGMDILAFPSLLKFIVTADVLVISVTIDAVTKRRREAKVK